KIEFVLPIAQRSFRPFLFVLSFFRVFVIAFIPRSRLMERPLRIVLAKVGLDGHDRGIKVVARALRDAGMHVIYAGLWQTPEAVVRAVADEDADWLRPSPVAGGDLTL